MRILALSSLYPPHCVGGYEQGCHEVLTRLRRRGHETCILTSTHGGRGPRRDGNVFRWLHLDFATRGGGAGAWSLVRQEITARRGLRRLVALFQPDLLYVWSPRFVSVAPLAIAAELGLPLCAYVSDDWLARWDDVDNWRNAGAALRTLVAAVAGSRRPGRPALAAQFPSRHVQQQCLDAGWPVADAPVLPWGVDTSRFAPRTPVTTGPLRILCAGQMVPHKGMHTAIEACRLLAESRGLGEATLTLVGPSRDSAYRAHLQRQVREAGMTARVDFAGEVAAERLPSIFQAHDVLLFSSTIPEASSLTLLEAMSTGLAVVATATGGNAEILRDEGNALLFPPQDAAACAAQLGRLVAGPALRQRLGAAARETILGGFDLEVMVNRIESHLQSMLA